VRALFLNFYGLKFANIKRDDCFTDRFMNQQFGGTAMALMVGWVEI
jgi:hypothetical protein